MRHFKALLATKSPLMADFMGQSTAHKNLCHCQCSAPSSSIAAAEGCCEVCWLGMAMVVESQAGQVGACDAPCCCNVDLSLECPEWDHVVPIFSCVSRFWSCGQTSADFGHVSRFLLARARCKQVQAAASRLLARVSRNLLTHAGSCLRFWSLPQF